MIKKNICVIFGGRSREHTVSCVSASFVAENLDTDKYNIYKIGITRSGEWYLFEGTPEQMRNGSWENGDRRRAVISPDTYHKGMLTDNGVVIPVDAVFPVLHGEYGEDGSIQGLFKLAGIPYVGPGIAASAAGLDKVHSKILFDRAGIKQTKWIYFDNISAVDFSAVRARILENFTYPVFVKPANTGSSIGISKAHNDTELKKALFEAGNVDKKVIIEEAVDAHEIECAALGNDDVFISVPGEVFAAGEFYDYNSKYFDEGSYTAIPADIDAGMAEKIKETAKIAYKALGCAGLSRVDFLVDRHSGEIYLNEINTMPGFTEISMYPKLLMHEGMSYGEILDKLIELALES